jgi:hypothetical protein
VPEFEKKGYQGFWLPGRKINGRHGLCLVLKRRFDVDLASAQCVPAPEQPPVLIMPEFSDPEKPERSYIKKPMETALEKPKVDILVKATAHAPGGKPVSELEVGLKIAGVMERSLRVLGRRVARWVAPKKWVTQKEKDKGERQEWAPPVFSDPAPFTALPLTHEHAYGGWASIILEADVAEQAAGFQEDAKKQADRRARKKEIEKQLQEEAQKQKDDAKAAKEGGVKDELAKAKADQAFGAPSGPGVLKEGGTLMVDAETLQKLSQEGHEREMEKVSAFRLGAGREGEAAAEVDSAEALAAAAAPVKEAGTQMLDLSQIEGSIEERDELHKELQERSIQEARKLTDEHGALRSRATEFGDIQLSDPGWVEGAKPELREKPSEAESPHPQMPFAANMCGRGFCVSPLQEAVDELELPRIEWPDEPLQPAALVVPLESFDLKALPWVAGWGPYSFTWYPRAGFAGAYPWDVPAAEAAMQKTLEEYDEEDPDDQKILEVLSGIEVPLMRPEWFQDACPRMQVDRVNGNEEVSLTNLTPDGHLYLKLPGTHPTARLDIGIGDKKPIAMRLDTLTFDLEDPKQPAVEMLWRGFYPMASFEEMETFRKLDFVIGELDQEQWFDLKRQEEQAEVRPPHEGTVALKAIDPAELEPQLTGEEAERGYQGEVAQIRGKAEEVGPLKDDGAVVFRQDLEQKLSDDAWDDDFRGRQQEVAVEGKRLQAELDKDKLKAIKKQAREQADQEFGIVREDPNHPKAKPKQGKGGGGEAG